MVKGNTVEHIQQLSCILTGIFQLVIKYNPNLVTSSIDIIFFKKKMFSYIIDVLSEHMETDV